VTCETDERRKEEDKSDTDLKEKGGEKIGGGTS